ncbi:hypothetical protein SDC9_186105 [bioreactor metagenome]|uniref:Uncharacterized protein n=1 Tax=bioreactor metagenome TaxID=1076179 RepID=A0A645HHS8_9ZZZZ
MDADDGGSVGDLGVAPAHECGAGGRCVIQAQQGEVGAALGREQDGTIAALLAGAVEERVAGVGAEEPAAFHGGSDGLAGDAMVGRGHVGYAVGFCVVQQRCGAVVV